MKNFIKSFGEKLLKAEHFVVVTCCIVMVLLVFITVPMRRIFKVSIPGLEELIMVFAFGIYFIGGALGSREETQITADVMSLFIKDPRRMMLLRSFQNLVDAVLIGICAVFSTQEMLFVLAEGSRTTGMKIPMWIVYTIILVGLFLMAFYALAHCVRYFQKYRHYNESGEGEQA